MKTTPILFSTDMVRAIEQLIKKMTRRTKGLEKINESPNDWYFTNCTTTCDDKKEFLFKHRYYEGDNCDLLIPCLYGKVGDILWVRESFYEPKLECLNGKYYYKADLKDKGWDFKWKPSIHMPKSACRIFLKITDIRVERLQDISEVDAVAEGIKREKHEGQTIYYFYPCEDLRDDTYLPYPKTSFYSLWTSINAKSSWSKNPWVWVIQFEKTERPADFLTPKP